MTQHPETTAAAVPIETLDVENSETTGETLGSDTYDENSIVDDEYPDSDIRMLADALITSNGEVIADVMVGIREALDKLNKVLYTKLK